MDVDEEWSQIEGSESESSYSSTGSDNTESEASASESSHPATSDVPESDLDEIDSDGSHDSNSPSWSDQGEGAWDRAEYNPDGLIGSETFEREYSGKKRRDRCGSGEILSDDELKKRKRRKRKLPKRPDPWKAAERQTSDEEVPSPESLLQAANDNVLTIDEYELIKTHVPTSYYSLQRGDFSRSRHRHAQFEVVGRIKGFTKRVRIVAIKCICKEIQGGLVTLRLALQVPSTDKPLYADLVRPSTKYWQARARHDLSKLTLLYHMVTYVAETELGDIKVLNSEYIICGLDLAKRFPIKTLLDDLALTMTDIPAFFCGEEEMFRCLAEQRLASVRSPNLTEYLQSRRHARKVELKTEKAYDKAVTLESYVAKVFDVKRTYAGLPMNVLNMKPHDQSPNPKGRRNRTTPPAPDNCTFKAHDLIPQATPHPHGARQYKSLTRTNGRVLETFKKGDCIAIAPDPKDQTYIHQSKVWYAFVEGFFQAVEEIRFDDDYADGKDEEDGEYDEHGSRDGDTSHGSVIKKGELSRFLREEDKETFNFGDRLRDVLTDDAELFLSDEYAGDLKEIEDRTHHPVIHVESIIGKVTIHSSWKGIGHDCADDWRHIYAYAREVTSAGPGEVVGEFRTWDGRYIDSAEEKAQAIRRFEVGPDRCVLECPPTNPADCKAKLFDVNRKHLVAKKKKGGRIWMKGFQFHPLEDMQEQGFTCRCKCDRRRPYDAEFVRDSEEKVYDVTEGREVHIEFLEKGDVPEWLKEWHPRVAPANRLFFKHVAKLSNYLSRPLGLAAKKLASSFPTLAKAYPCKRFTTKMDTYAGAGLLGNAFTNVGFSTSMIVEHNDDAADTYVENTKCRQPFQFKCTRRCKHIHTRKEVRTVVLELLALGQKCKDAVLIVCPECRGFTWGNRQKEKTTSKQHRFQFLMAISLIIAADAPFFLLENVMGLLWNTWGRQYLALVQIVLIRHGYQVGLDGWNSRQFGTKQNRQRLFLRGAKRSEVLPERPVQTHLAPGVWSYTIGVDAKGDKVVVRKQSQSFARCYIPTSHDEITSDLPLIGADGHKRQYKDPLHFCPQVPKSAEEKRIAKYLVPGRRAQDLEGCRDGEGRKFGRFQGYLSRVPGLGETDVGIPSVLGNLKQIPLSNREERGVTLRELGRYQAVPDTYKFRGTPASILQQIANGVPFTVGDAYALEIWKAVSLSDSWAESSDGGEAIDLTDDGGLEVAPIDLTGWSNAGQEDY
ncbi:uroporphyrin-III C-methyltransferase [Rhizophlyctis rosea]|uniref:DNA (cytosine-5-)-methyltransferase n=1 Tax=Rhizophlyctis rosea TaxID=64517 RepID=A0AAD5S5Q3_9FUNG|nr:uroporphyrin-III C-methyltransferase [Rhizophlyctis rosea]